MIQMMESELTCKAGQQDCQVEAVRNEAEIKESIRSFLSF